MDPPRQETVSSYRGDLETMVASSLHHREEMFYWKKRAASFNARGKARRQDLEKGAFRHRDPPESNYSIKA